MKALYSPIMNRTANLRGREAELECQLARLVALQADRRIDVLLEDLVGRIVRDLFDIHAAMLRGHEHHLGRRTVQHQAEIEFAVDGRTGFNQQALHLLPGGAGLVRDELHTQNLLGILVGLFDGLGQLDAAALAATAGVDLRFDDDDRVASREQRLGGVVGLFDGGGHLAAGHGDAVFAEDFLGLVLVDFHAFSNISPTAFCQTRLW
jgi:hypothetical protein